MACLFITYGMQLQNPKACATSALKSFNKIGRDKLRYVMTNTAYRKHRITLSKFASLPYASVAIDEGSTLSIQTLHFVIESPLTDLKSYPFTSVRMNGGKACHYIKAIPSGLRQLILSKVNIGSIVIDGNKAQLKAFSPSYKKSLYNVSDIDFKKILIIPCLCHRINNAFKRVAMQDRELNELLKLLYDISDKCRENQDYIGTICPKHEDTRWIYDYDIVKFLMVHKDKVSDLIEKFPQDDFSHLLKVLKVFKVLVTIFENPHTQMKDAFILLERGINCLYEINGFYPKEFVSMLAHSLEDYTIKASDGGIWSLAYCLTPYGQADFRNRNIHSQNSIEKSYLHYFHIAEEDNDEEDEEDEDDKIITFDEKEEIVMNDNGQLVNTEKTDSDDDSVVEEEDDDEQCGIGTDEPGMSPIKFVNYLISAKEYLKQLLALRKLNKQQIKEAMASFNSYIDDNEPFSDYINANENFSWIQIRNSVVNWTDIADIAERLLNSATSEASCERTILF